MEEANILIFDAYRYQILPISKAIQLSIDDHDISYNDLIEKKNSYFAQILQDEELMFKRGNVEIVHTTKNLGDENFVLRLGLQKIDTIEKPDFTKEIIDRYPDVYVLIDNNPDQQILLIQRNYRAVDKTERVSRVLERNFSKYLAQFHLSIYIQPIYTESEFWALTVKYERQITKLIFEFIRPNLANISGGLAEDLRNFQDDSNAHKGKLELEAAKKGTLDIDQESKELRGMVNYSSQGGGNIYMKVKGMRKRLKTNEGSKSVEIEELTIKNLDSGTLENIIKRMME